MGTPTVGNRPCKNCPHVTLCKFRGSCAITDKPVANELAHKHPDAKETNPKSVAAKNKVSTSLIPPVALIELSQQLRAGAIKYGPMNWREKPIAVSVLLDAIDRHMMRYRAGEEVSQDDGRPHLAAIMSSCAIILDAAIHGTLLDDRYHMENPEAITDILDKYQEQNAQS